MTAAPDFTLPATDGRTCALYDFAGQTLVLYFYPKDSTPGCTSEARDFAALYDDFRAAGCEVLGVSRDSLKAPKYLTGIRKTLCQPTQNLKAAHAKWIPHFD